MSSVFHQFRASGGSRIFTEVAVALVDVAVDRDIHVDDARSAKWAIVMSSCLTGPAWCTAAESYSDLGDGADHHKTGNQEAKRGHAHTALRTRNKGRRQEDRPLAIERFHVWGWNARWNHAICFPD